MWKILELYYFFKLFFNYINKFSRFPQASTWLHALTIQEIFLNPILSIYPLSHFKVMKQHKV